MGTFVCIVPETGRWVTTDNGESLQQCHIRYFRAQALCYPKPRGSKVAHNNRWPGNEARLVCLLSSSPGQFFRVGVQVYETVGLLLLPSMPPVPVTSWPVWRFMERDSPSDQQCWEALNPGHQGKKLIEGHYLDYTVKHILSHDFRFTSGPL